CHTTAHVELSTEITMTSTITRLCITNSPPLNPLQGLRTNLSIGTRSDLLFHNLIPPFQPVHGHIPTPQDPLNHMSRSCSDHPRSSSTIIFHIGRQSRPIRSAPLLHHLLLLPRLQIFRRNLLRHAPIQSLPFLLRILRNPLHGEATTALQNRVKLLQKLLLPLRSDR
ncbi:hypothetical protein VIGAN_10151300, partial [Vigna angularis var. angularis]